MVSYIYHNGCIYKVLKNRHSCWSHKLIVQHRVGPALNTVVTKSFEAAQVSSMSCYTV